MKCKNIECSNETIGKRVYCSLACRNIYVNKYLRNYEKVYNTRKNKEKIKEEDYLKNPKLCNYCGKIIGYLLRKNKFCDNSCSAKAVNKDRIFVNGYIKKPQKQYELNCNFCGESFLRKRSDIKFCSKECVKKHRGKDVDKFKTYKQDTNFKFNLADYKEEFDFSLIEKYGWYSPSNKNNNLEGVSRDHMFSVKEGFNLGISPKLISHPANCRLIKHTDNISKNSKCSISYNELLERINKFEEKYKRV